MSPPFSCMTFNSFYCMFNWRSRREPTCSWSMTYFHLYISFDWPSTMCMCRLRANVKLAHCKFKSYTFLAIFLAVSSFNKCPVLFPQPTILRLRQCQHLLNGSPYGYLCVRHQPRYNIQHAVLPFSNSSLNVVLMVHCHKTRLCRSM